MWGASLREGARERERVPEQQRARQRGRESGRARASSIATYYNRRQKQFIELFVSFFCVCCGFFSFIRGLWYHSPGIQHIILYGIVHIHTDICMYEHLYVFVHMHKFFKGSWVSCVLGGFGFCYPVFAV